MRPAPSEELHFTTPQSFSSAHAAWRNHTRYAESLYASGAVGIAQRESSVSQKRPAANCFFFARAASCDSVQNSVSPQNDVEQQQPDTE